MGYLTQFAGKASRLGAAGVAALFFTALALVLTIDRTLNGIWRARRPRPLAQRIVIYWSVMTLGPLLLAASVLAPRQRRAPAPSAAPTVPPSSA